MPDGGAPEYASLPFDEAIQFLRQKVNVPSARWTDIIGGAHARAFTVAGATKDGMLADFRTAIDQALSQGTTLEDFRKSFDDIVQRYGWDHTGTRNFRTRVIFGTNLSTAYAAGRYAQMTDPDVRRVMPYWVYRHSDNSKCPRKDHQAWNGLVLRHDDPWWSTHYPPNGWGCQCYVEAITERQLRAMGKNGPDQAPPDEMRQVQLVTSAGPISIDTPKGVDPGWGYSVGEANQGRALSQQQMDAWAQQGSDAWESLTPGDWQSAGLPKSLPADPPKAVAIPPPKDRTAIQSAIQRAIGGSTAALQLPTGDTIGIDAAALAQHATPAQSPYIPLLPELIDDPAEIWLRFERHKGTGKVVLRQRLVKLLQLGRNHRLALALEASGGQLDGINISAEADLNALRVGKLIWRRP